VTKSYEFRGREAPILEQLGVRVIVMRAGTFVDLQKSMELTLREEVEALLYEAGIKAGRSSTKVLLREWGKKDFMRRWAEFYSSDGCGWFKLEKAEVEPEKGGVVRISGSFIAEEYGRSEKPVCHFLCGFLVGVFQELLGVELICEETKCAAMGEQYCEFKLERCDTDLANHNQIKRQTSAKSSRY